MKAMTSSLSTQSHLRENRFYMILRTQRFQALGACAEQTHRRSRDGRSGVQYIRTARTNCVFEIRYWGSLRRKRNFHCTEELYTRTLSCFVWKFWERDVRSTFYGPITYAQRRGGAVNNSRSKCPIDGEFDATVFVSMINSPATVKCARSLCVTCMTSLVTLVCIGHLMFSICKNCTDNRESIS